MRSGGVIILRLLLGGLRLGGLRLGGLRLGRRIFNGSLLSAPLLLIRVLARFRFRFCFSLRLPLALEDVVSTECVVIDLV